MASGKLGSADLAATTDTLLYTVPPGITTTASVRVANRNGLTVSIRVAIGSGGSPTNADYITYDVNVPANSILEDTGVVLSAGEKIWVRASSTGVTARVHGFEE